eukprot:1201045-Prymnesium_polylepis.1
MLQGGRPPSWACDGSRRMTTRRTSATPRQYLQQRGGSRGVRWQEMEAPLCNIERSSANSA